MTVELNRLSREFVWWKLGTDDLTGATVDVALLADATAVPATGDWTAAQLIDPAHADGDGANWWARLLIGPGGTKVLAVGDFQSWVRVTTATEVPVRKPGVVSIT